MWTPFKGDPYGILGYACYRDVFDPTNPDSVVSKQKKQENPDEETDDDEDDDAIFR